jgi:hypothetical protein
MICCMISTPIHPHPEDIAEQLQASPASYTKLDMGRLMCGDVSCLSVCRRIFFPASNRMVPKRQLFQQIQTRCKSTQANQIRSMNSKCSLNARLLQSLIHHPLQLPQSQFPFERKRRHASRDPSCALRQMSSLLASSSCSYLSLSALS